MTKKPRLNLELAPSTKKLIDRLKQRTNAPSITEVIRKAVKLYDLLDQCRDANGALTLVVRDGERERKLMIVD